MTGAVLNTINTRLDAATFAFILQHGGAKVLITDREFSGTVKEALAQLEHRLLRAFPGHRPAQDQCGWQP
jgi:fatty-acyl-CoA synthase